MVASGDYSRREFLGITGGLAAAVALGACSNTSGADRIDPRGPEVSAAEAARTRPGAAVTALDLTASAFDLALGSLVAPTWAYGDRVPGPEVRMRAGDILEARFINDLPVATTVHWHGIRLRNDMDGAAHVTQDPVPPGGTFVYRFTVPDPGTYWFHPHLGLQLDRGLYAPLIIENPAEPGAYDRDLVLVLDDWTSGIGDDPERTLRTLREGGGAHAQHGNGGGPSSEALGGAGGDVAYPLFLVNGRPPEDPALLEARPGERLRIRLINAASDTAFRFALAGHRLTVTHTDGFPVEPVTVDSLLIGMSERFDVLVTVAEGSFPIVAEAEAKANRALAYLHAGGPELSPSELRARPSELDRDLLDLAQLKATAGVQLPPGRPARTYRLVLGGGTDRYRWTINGRVAADAEPLEVRAGEKVRLVLQNQTTMFHPMHLHGHTFQVVEPTPGGPRKDSLMVLPQQRLAIDFMADNPGQWVLHCHNVYHQEGGMETLISYVR